MKDYSLERCHCASSNCYCANIKRAENKITALYNRHLEKAGITRGQYALLANIERNPGIASAPWPRQWTWSALPWYAT